MKQVYSILSKTLLMALGMVLIQQAQAQSSSTTSAGNCGAVVANFNSNSGNHSSPSIYGGIFDSAFYYNPIRGYWTDMDGGRTTPPLSPRVLTIISPPYTNPSPAGQFNVGFYYIVPSATIDRFQVRIFSVSAGPGGTTVSNEVASSDVQYFSAWSSPAHYVDYNHTSSAGSSPANVLLTGDSGHVCIRINDADITNAPGTFYRVEIAYVLNTAPNDDFFAVYDDLSIGSTAPAPLPVNFIGVVANRVDNGVINLRWDVGDETNVQQYVVEKSTTGADFSTEGTVTANKKMVYSFIDGAAKEPVIYYRIKSVDIDGKVNYSGIIKLINGNSFSNTIKLYPSPAHNQITLQHNLLSNNARITITTMDGRVIRTIVPSIGVSNTMVDVSNLSAGMYLLRLNDNGKIQSTTFVKQ